MKIINSKNKIVDFADIKAGEVFSVHAVEDIYMKTECIETTSTDLINCVNLSNGKLEYLAGTYAVTPIDCELII